MAVGLVPVLALAQATSGPGASPPAAVADTAIPSKPSGPTLLERQHAERRVQIQLLARDAGDLLEKLRETNTWMAQQSVGEPSRALGTHLEASVQQLRDVARSLGQLCDDPALQKDKERLRDLDRFKENVRLLLRVHDRSHLALRKFVRMP